VSIRNGKAIGRPDIPEATLFGVAGMGVRLLLRMFSRGGRDRGPPCPVGRSEKPLALLDLDEAGGGIVGGPGNDILGAWSGDSRYDPSESVLVALRIKGPAVGVGPADVDRRV